MGRAQITVGVFADVASAELLGLLNQALPFDVIFFGLDELGCSGHPGQSAPRPHPEDQPLCLSGESCGRGGLFAGVYYRSRLGDNLDNFALRGPRPLGTPGSGRRPDSRQ